MRGFLNKISSLLTNEREPTASQEPIEVSLARQETNTTANNAAAVEVQSQLGLEEKLAFLCLAFQQGNIHTQEFGLVTEATSKLIKAVEKDSIQIGETMLHAVTGSFERITPDQVPAKEPALQKSGAGGISTELLAVGFKRQLRKLSGLINLGQITGDQLTTIDQLITPIVKVAQTREFVKSWRDALFLGLAQRQFQNRQELQSSLEGYLRYKGCPLEPQQVGFRRDQVNLTKNKYEQYKEHTFKVQIRTVTCLVVVMDQEVALYEVINGGNPDSFYEQTAVVARAIQLNV
jgi:hypothetical protein